MAERSKTYALLVGIEQYDASQRWALDGPASDVLRMLQWTVKNGIPKDHITVLLTTLDKNVQVKQEIEILLGRPPGSTRLEDIIGAVEAFQDIAADLFLFYWGGHGWSTSRGEHCLYCMDATLQVFKQLDLSSLFVSMQTDLYKGLAKQVFLVDACANYISNSGNRPPHYDFGEGKVLKTIEQFAMFAARPGESARNPGDLQAGLFTHELLQQLEVLPPDGQWPPNFPAIAKLVYQRFNDRKELGQISQTPSYFWLRNSATGDGEVFNISPPNILPLIELQKLLTQTLGDHEEEETLARVWYTRSLRHVQTAIEPDRDPGGRSIADMLSALDDWQQQPRGNLPLLTFAEGLAVKAQLSKEIYDRVKKLTSLRAQEKGLDRASIETARECLMNELERAPDAFQIFFVPERKDLSVDDPQMTYQVTLYTWEGASETGQGGGCILCGKIEGQTLAEAQKYIARRLITDLADPSPSIIEFFVPYRLMCCDVDQWPYKKDDEMVFSVPLGTE